MHYLKGSKKQKIVQKVLDNFTTGNCSLVIYLPRKPIIHKLLGAMRDRTALIFPSMHPLADSLPVFTIFLLGNLILAT